LVATIRYLKAINPNEQALLAVLNAHHQIQDHNVKELFDISTKETRNIEKTANPLQDRVVLARVQLTKKCGAFQADELASIQYSESLPCEKYERAMEFVDLCKRVMEYSQKAKDPDHVATEFVHHYLMNRYTVSKAMMKSTSVLNKPLTPPMSEDEDDDHADENDDDL
jgi:hypothetical protein